MGISYSEPPRNRLRRGLRTSPTGIRQPLHHDDHDEGAAIPAEEQSLVVRLLVPTLRCTPAPTPVAMLSQVSQNRARKRPRLSEVKEETIDLTIEDRPVRIKEEQKDVQPVSPSTQAGAPTAAEPGQSEEMPRLELRKIEIQQKLLAMGKRP